MNVVRHSDPDAFIAAVAPMATRGEAAASFFTGWAHVMKRAPSPDDEAVYLATFGERGAAIQRGEGPVVVGRSDPDAAMAFATDLAADQPGLQGVVGSPAAADAFARRWHELTGRGHALRVRMRQHVLHEVREVPDAPGAARVAVPEDIPWLVECQTAFIIEVGIPDTPGHVAAKMGKRVERGEYWIWDHDARAALVGFNDAAPEFARIAPVYTLPDRRGRGYATALVATISRELLSRGKRRLFLTTDIANPTSNAIYARIGFRPECDDIHLDFVDAPG